MYKQKPTGGLCDSCRLVPALSQALQVLEESLVENEASALGGWASVISAHQWSQTKPDTQEPRSLAPSLISKLLSLLAYHHRMSLASGFQVLARVLQGLDVHSHTQRGLNPPPS